MLTTDTQGARRSGRSRKRPLRLLQVGLGTHGRTWARRVIPDVKEVELVGYVDANPNALRMLREESEVPPDRCFESVMDAVVATHPEAVLVTTSLAGHEPVTRAALEAGLHVLVEKPFAPSLGAAEQLVDLAAAKGLVLMVSQNYRRRNLGTIALTEAAVKSATRRQPVVLSRTGQAVAI